MVVQPLPPLSAQLGLKKPDTIKPSLNDANLMGVARNLESSFLSEMLRHAGLGEARKAFGGGVGEEQFSSFLRDIQARQMSASGGLGLAEMLFKSLKTQKNGG